MRGNWDQMEPRTLVPEQDSQLQESILGNHPEQQQAREQQAPQQQEQTQSIQTTPGWPNVVVKEEPAEEKNNDSGISPGHYISDSASPPSRQSPAMTANGSISPSSTVSQDSNVVPNNYTYTPPTPPQSMSPTMDFKATLDYAHAQLYGPKSANQMNHQSNGLPITDEEASSKSVFGFELPEELEYTAEPLRCPVCSYLSRKRVAFCVHIKSHCSVASGMCEGNEFNKSMLKQLLNGSNIGNLDRMSPHLEDCDLDNTELGLRIPRVNPQGKVKTFRCKQCAFVGMTKVDFWDHSRVHIKLEKLLTCPRCPFVTEYKHHLEYHLRNHFGSKPYKCEQCDYSCVNKSMLNSHLKSHSNVYQFRCKDCSYATKYCHSLKLHLRKYDHSPAMVLNADGSPNPLPIIDVYGTRRGPKAKPKKEDQPSPVQPMQQTSPLAAAIPQFQFNPVNGITGTGKINSFQGFTGQAPMPPTPTLMGFSYNPVFAGFPSINNAHFAAAQVQAQAEAIQAAGIDSIDKRIELERLTAQYVEFTNSLLPEPKTDDIEAAKEAAARNMFSAETPVNYAMACQTASHPLTSPIKQEKIDSAESSNPLDLSKPEGAAHDLSSRATPTESRVNSPKTSGTSRRKGRAIKLDRRFIAQDSDEEMPQESQRDSPTSERVESRPQSSSPASSAGESHNSTSSNEFTCQYCEISFGNEVMHSVHMGYHGYQNPYTCNMCGLPCTDKVTFFLHIARVKH